jgi:hypothetical protein
MSAIPQGFASWGTACYPQFGQGVYVGRNPGSSNIPGGQPGGYGGGGSTATFGVTIQTDSSTNGFISSMTNTPQNVFRIVGAFGNSYIQGENILFGLPYQGGGPLGVQPGSNQMSIPVLSQLSSLKIVNTSNTGIEYSVNANQLGSTIAGYGWANTG